MTQIQPISIAARCPQLTPREREVCAEVIRGGEHKEIGRRLGLSCRTIETHKYASYRKLGVTNASELILLVLGHPEIVP